jgi:hypothetical protein
MILNELQYAENVLKTYEYAETTGVVLNILAKYYLHREHMNNYDVIEKLNNFMQITSTDYNPVKWRESLEQTIKYANKHNLLEIEYIPICKAEIDTIDSVESKPMQRLLFTMLCFAKVYNTINSNNNGWVNVKQKEIFASAHINKTVENQCYMLHELYEKGYISFSNNQTNLNIKVNYIADDNDFVLKIIDFKDLGYEYLLYKGENYIRCQKCNKFTKDNKQHNKKYCAHCAKYEINESRDIICVDCGKIITVSSTNGKTNRCSQCYKIYRIAYKAQNEKERRIKQP